ncbi:MAG: hypothetical protein QG658_403 [Patescibacteria group bacterium]|nr:hypothetical protein [Patescibacteria group bacterium]
MNLNMKLDSTSLKNLAKKLSRSLGVIGVLAVGGIVLYTGYFLTNLLYATGDISELEKKQAESSASKQVRFNEKTLESLDDLTPAGNTPSTEDVGKEDPFAPN